MAHHCWGRVVSVATAAQIANEVALIVHNVADGNTVTAGIHDKVDRRRLRTHVTGFVFDRDFPGIVAIRQRWCRGVAPVTFLVYRYAHGSTVTQIDNRGTVRFTLTTVGWGVVIGGAVIGDETRRAEVVPQLNVRRCQRINGIDNNHPLAGFRTAVTGSVFGHGTEAVLALRQIRIKVNGPAASCYHGTADRIRVSAIVQIDRGAILCGTGDGRACVVRDAAVLYRTHVRVNVVDHVSNGRSRRNTSRQQVKRERVRRLGTQPRFVLRHNGDIVMAVGHAQCWRPGPDPG